ncbi:MAG: glutamate-5-semialdehyde dehydrogenase [candidate division NC10 bacterium]|nr:glutamate-5-semialdehyde dehydrogenase [candidate division NC10 bacterium]
MREVEVLARQAREAVRGMAVASPEVKNRALHAMAEGLLDHQEEIRQANAADLAGAEGKSYPPAFLDRLRLTSERIQGMARGLKEVAALPDPVGEVTGMERRPNGLWVGRMRVPLGVVAVIYESRPNVTADVTGLCLKAGNAILLRGGSEAIRSNRAIAAVLTAAAEAAGLPKGVVGIVETTDRAAVHALLKLDRYIDLVIPRGGEELVRTVKEASTIPVIAHEKGLCHIYVDAAADHSMAEEVVFNAKVERPGVCNAVETLLLHEQVAAALLPGIAARLAAAGVELRGCPKTRTVLPHLIEATEKDWETEYLGLILSIKVVDSFEEAVAHIRQYSSGLAEAIVTADYSRALCFLREVDAGVVFVNASTRFADGGEFGLGAEIGISTQKLHARGPMGLKELTCTKFIALGEGQVRDSRRAGG